MVFFKKKVEDDFKKNNKKNFVLNLNSKENDLNENSVFDKEFLDVIEADKKFKSKEEDVSFEIREFEIVKNSVDELKNEILRLKKVVIEHFDDNKNTKSFSCEEFKNFFSKIISDLHENVYDERKKFSELVDLYKEQVFVLKEQNELLKKILKNFDENKKE